MKNKERQPRVCIIMPAYNESKVIKDVVEDAISSFQSSSYVFEVVVINDASKDSTGKKAKEAGATVISHVLNCGAGGATTTGLRYAQQNNYDIAATMDSDGQHLSSDVLRGISELTKHKYDLLIGSRLINSQGMSKTKIIGNKGLSLITHLLFGINHSDSQSGLRIFSRKALDELRWKTSGYEFCSEMLWRAKQLGLSIGEYPIATIYTDYSKAKGQNNWNGINIVKSLIKQRVKELLG